MKNNSITKKEKMPLQGNVRKGFKLFISLVVCLTMVFTLAVTAFAADDPVAVVNNLSTFIFGLIRAVGLIILGFGIVQVGLSLKSHDPSQRANCFLTVAGGIVIDGLFNGNGYSLNNITLVPNDYESITGKQLFGKVTGEIKNLEVHNFKVKKFWDAMCGASALMANASGTVENVIFDGFIEGRVAIDYNGTAYTTWSGATGGYLMKSSNNATVKNIYIDIERDDDSDDLRITHGAGTLNYDNVYVVSKAKQSTTYTSYNVINNGFFSVGTEKNFVDNYYSNVDTQMWYIGADNKPLLKNGLEALDLPEGLLEIKLYSEGTAGSLLEKNYINTIYYSPNSTIESLPEASKEDHILKTWTNITEGKTAAIGDKITQNLTYVANWARVWFATFDSNGGSLVDPIRVENGKTLTADGVTRIPEPTLKDKAFCCWQELVKDGVKVEKENKLVCTYNFETEVLTIEEEFKDLVEQEIVTAIVDEIDCSILKVKLYVDKNKEDYNVIEINLTNKTFTITDSNTACTAVDCKNATVATAEKDTVSCTSKKLKVSFTFPTFSFSTAFEKDYNLIAHWVDVVKVSFDANGGSPVSAINVGKGLTIKEKNMPTASRDGYTFIGWHLVSVLKDVEGNPVLDENGQEVTIVAEEVFDLSTVITEPIKLQAAWTPNVTLKFNSNGAGSVNDLQVGKNLTLAASRVPSPTRAGYILLGWVLDGETELYDFTTRAFTDDASFTAKWQECATVIDFASSSYANSIIDIANPVTSTDFKFVTDGASLKVAVESRKDLTFKLNANDWSKYNTIIFRISHDSMNASNWFLTADTSKSIWHYKNELDNYGYQHYGRLGSWVEVKLVAKDNAKYDLYYNNVLRAQDVAIKKNSATNVYEFPVQFYNDQLVESNFYVSNVIGIEDYATLTFDENYASKASEVYVTKGLKIATSIVPQPQREGYQFLGWVKQGETEVYTFTNAVFTEDTTFVAQWVATPAIINFSEQGAINSVTGVSGYKGYSISTAASYNYGLETASLKLAVDSQKTGEIKLDISKWGGYKEIMFRVAHDGLNNSAYFCFADTSKSIWNHTNVLGNYGLQHYGRVGNWATIKLVAKDGGLYDMYYNNFLRAENVSIGNAFGIIVFNNTTAAHNFYISNIVGVEDSVTLTYNEGYDSKTSVVKVTNGLTVGASQIPAPTREGYKFLGWIKQGETELFDFTNAKFTEATTFNASWEETPVLINFAKPDALSKVSSESGYTDYSVTTDVAFTGETSSLRFGVDAETSKYVLLDTTGWSNYAEVIFRITHDCYNHSAYFATVDKDNSVFNIDSVVGHYGFQMWGQKGRWLEVKLVFNTDGTYNLYYNDVLRGENLTLNSTFAIKGYNEQVSDPHNIIVSNVIAVPKATSEN